MSTETRRRLSEAARGTVHTPEHNARVSAALKGRRLSDEHVARLRGHGRSGDPNYDRWRTMMSRCHDETHPAYRWYGARGIQVHRPWHDVGVFCDWVAEHLGVCPEGFSIDRVDNDRGYVPGNVRWASRSEQVANRRRILVELECEGCGGTFLASRRDARTCSASCRSAVSRQRRVSTKRA